MAILFDPVLCLRHMPRRKSVYLPFCFCGWELRVDHSQKHTTNIIIFHARFEDKEIAA